ncbi:hypothetical protein BAC2_01134 [uncultured bacterium]|nr:hypothetical protein BAC2_01134 [uncultured bacterium]
MLSGFYYSSRYMFLIAAGLALVTGKDIDWLVQVVFPGTGIVLFLTLVYSFIIVTLIWRRTGSIWYLFNSDQRELSAFLTSVSVLVVSLVIRLVVREFYNMFIFQAIAFGAFLILKSLWGREVIQRAKKERGGNSNLWQALGQVSPWKILLLRIPHVHEAHFQSLNIQGRG